MDTIIKNFSEREALQMCKECLLDVFFTHYGVNIEIIHLSPADEKFNGYVMAMDYLGITLHFLVYNKDKKEWFVDLILQDTNEFIEKYVHDDTLYGVILKYTKKVFNDKELLKLVLKRKEKLEQCRSYEERITI